MKKCPDFIKICFRDEIFKIRPVPTDFEDLISNVKEMIAGSPSCPNFTYKDDHGDVIKVSNSKNLRIYYDDLLCNPNLILRLQQNLEELAHKLSNETSLKSSEDDIINLSLLGVIDINYELLQSVKFIQTSFSKSIIYEIINLIKQSSIEKISEEFKIPWEVLFYMTQEPSFNHKKPTKKLTYNKLKNIFRPSKCLSIVKEFLAEKVTKEDIMNKYNISSDVFSNWVDLYRNPSPKPMELSHIPDKEKLKLVSSYLLGEVTLEELKMAFDITPNTINSWALHFAQEKVVYQRERLITAEEKYDLLQRYLKGEYTITQFQNEFGVRGNLLYRWVKQVQGGKTLTSSTIFRTASDELEKAYNIFLNSLR